jgi:hypothetical protein
MHIPMMAALLIAPPPAADPFCDTLKQVVAAAPGKFAALNGRAWLLDTGIKGPQGRLACSARNDTAETPPTPYYYCEAAAPSARDSADIRLLAERVGRCLAVEAVELGNPPELEDFPRAYAFALPGADILVSYTIFTNSAPAMSGGGSFFHLALRVSPRLRD